MSIYDRLKEAITTGEVLLIKYHGGSQPGTTREIHPISLSGDTVRARCITSNETKTFKLDKIEICNGENQNNVTWKPPEEREFKYVNIVSLYELNRVELESLSWHINHDEESISLHRRYKNGNPLKIPEVHLCYDKYNHQYIIGADGKEYEEIKERVSPWMVGSKSFCRHYKELDMAADVFMEQARLLAPIKKDKV
jgi:hypothetical protein